VETSEYLASIVGLGFFLIILWYIVSQGWLPEWLFQLAPPLIGLIALVLTAIFVVEKIREL